MALKKRDLTPESGNVDSYGDQEAKSEHDPPMLSSGEHCSLLIGFLFEKLTLMLFFIAASDQYKRR